MAMQNYATQVGTAGGSSTVAGSTGLPVSQYPSGDQLAAVINAKLAQKAAAEAAAKRAQIAQVYAPQPQMPAPRYAAPMQARAIEQRAPASDPGIPNYVKMITSPGVVPGYARASAGDPGAVFAGYIPRDAAMPSSATFSRNPGPVGGAQPGGYDPYSHAAREASTDYSLGFYRGQ